MIRYLMGVGAALMVMSSVQAQDMSDEAAIGALVDRVYSVISGDVGEERNWDVFRDLYTDNAIMGQVSPGPEGHGRAVFLTPQDYITRSGPVLMEIGFHEVETHREVNIYGELAHVRTGYEGFRADQDGPYVSGINFLTVMKIEGQWKIVTIVWRPQSEDWPVAAQFEGEAD